MKQIWQFTGKHFSTLLAVFTLLFLGAGFLLFPRQVQNAVLKSAMNCFQLLVPALFPFIALTSFAVNSAAGKGINFIFSFVTEKIFRLPRVCGTAVIMGLIGGYPAGAAGVSILLKKGSIDREEAGRMLCFCVNPGAAFVIGFLSVTILRDAKAGMLLFLSVLSSSILLGLLTGIGKKPINSGKDTVEAQPTGTALVFAAQDAARGILKMCACILLFTSFTAVLDACGIISAVSERAAAAGKLSCAQTNAVIQLLLEITNGILFSAKHRLPAVIYAFSLAFGGICVHLQIFSFFKSFPVSVLKFFLFRVIHGVSAAAIYLFLLSRFPNTQAVFFSTAPQTALTATLEMSPTGGISLLLMCGMFLLLCALPGSAVIRRKHLAGQSERRCDIIKNINR